MEDVEAHIKVQFPSFDWKGADGSLSMSGGDIAFRSPRGTGRNPLPGKYRVVVKAPSFTTGPVEIEIAEPGKAPAAQLQTPVLKYLAENKSLIGKGSCFVGEVLSIGPLALFNVQSDGGPLRGERKLREIEYRVDEVVWSNEDSMEWGLKLRRGARVKILHELPADGSLPAQYNQGERLIVHFGWLMMVDKGNHPGADGAFPATPEDVQAFRDTCAAANKTKPGGVAPAR